MKSLFRMTTLLVTLALFASCGGGNKVQSSATGGGTSTNPISTGDGTLDSFANRVYNQSFATLYNSYGSVEYEFADLDNNYYFTRERTSAGTIIRDDDSLSSSAAVRDFLVSIVNGRQYYRVGCDVAPTNIGAYYNLFQRSYNYQDCYTFLANNTTYYIDLNYPIEANPIAKITYSTIEEDGWWIFNSYKTTVNGYYLGGIQNYGSAYY